MLRGNAQYLSCLHTYHAGHICKSLILKQYKRIWYTRTSVRSLHVALQGWGRFDLSGALPLPGLTHVNFRLQVADFGVINQGDMIWLRGLKATGTG
jgi:hypothetical protein